MIELMVLGIALVPGFAWLFFFLQEDDHEEPKWLIAFTFLLGVVGALVAFGIQFYGLQPLLYEDRNMALAFLAFLVLALVEELAKFGAAYFAVHDNEAFCEPIDAMIYMVVAALGFATLENIGAISSIVKDLPATATTAHQLSVVLQATSLRFVGATLLHTLTSALVGYYWAIAIRRFGEHRFILYGLILATFLHAVFNYLIIVKQGGFTYALEFVVVIGFFVLNDFEKFRGKKV